MKRPHLLDYKFAYGHIVTRLERQTYDERDVRDKGICTRYSFIWVLLPWTHIVDYVYHKNWPKVHYVKNEDDYLWDLVEVE